MGDYIRNLMYGAIKVSALVCKFSHREDNLGAEN